MRCSCSSKHDVTAKETNNSEGLLCLPVVHGQLRRKVQNYKPGNSRKHMTC